jgi:hypothetical protein
VTDNGDSLQLTINEVMLLVGKGDFSFGKSLFDQNPSVKSFSLAFQLIGVLKMRSLMNSAAKYIAELGGIFRLLQHIKYGFEHSDYLDAAVTAILGLKGEKITVGLFLAEKKKQSKIYSQSGTIRISLFDIAKWVPSPPAGFLHSLTSLNNGIYSEGELDELREIITRRENTLLMRNLRDLEFFSDSSPPWEDIRSFMKINGNLKLLKTLASVENYLESTRIDLSNHAVTLSELKRRLQLIESKESDNFMKLKAIEPLIYDFEQLKENNTKPIKIWMWGWSKTVSNWLHKNAETELVLLRIRFEIGKISQNHRLALSAQEYEFKCLDMLEDSGSDAGRTLRSKIYYDLFMFLDAQSGSESIEYFVDCVELTASYTNERQFKLRMYSLLEGLKRLENFQAYSNCVDWVKDNYGEKFFLSIGDIS